MDLNHKNQFKAYKLFYLTDDQSNSVSEKIFICNNDVLKTLRHQLSEKIKVYGVMGPIQQILKYLGNQIQEIEQVGKKQHKAQFMGIDKKYLNFYQFAQNQKPAIFLLKQQQHQNRKNQINAVFLVLISGNKLYYEKPFDQKSLVYILIRFMCDLCDDVVILYDKYIMENFTTTQCPFSSDANRIHNMKFRKNIKKNIQIVEHQMEYKNQLPLFERKKIDWKHSVFKSKDSYLQYFRYIDQKQMEIRINQTKKNKQQLIWNQIIENGQFQVSGSSQKFHKNTQKSKIEKYEHALFYLNKINYNIKKQIQTLIYSCVRDAASALLEKNSDETLKQNIKQKAGKYLQDFYFWTIYSNQSRPFISQNKIQFPQNIKVEEFIFTKTLLIVEEIFDQQTQVKNDQVMKIAKQNWKKCKNILLCTVFDKFEEAIQVFLSFDESIYLKVQKFQIVKFDITQGKSGLGFQLKRQPQIVLNLSSLKKSIPNLTYKQVEDIKLFKTKFLKQYRIFIISRKTQQQTQYQYLIYSFDRSQTNNRQLAKFKDKQLVFSFDETTRMVYILKTVSKQLKVFYLDDFQKPKDEKNFFLSKSQSNFQIVSYTTSRTPNQRFYYLDSFRDCLYCFDITENKHKNFYFDGNTLTPKKGHVYEFIKSFNSSAYIALGNALIIDICQVTINQQLNLIREVLCKQTSLFMGMSTHADERHQYLFLYSQQNYRVLVFQNMSCDTVIQQVKVNSEKGNPIIDIFYQAKEKFGIYKTYTVWRNTPLNKVLNLHHILNNEQQNQKIKAYLNLFTLENHKHFYQIYGKQKKIQESQFGLVVGLIDFINEAESRIPVQICTVDNGNIVPLKEGNIKDTFDGLQTKIQERCKSLTFGIVQRMLKQEKNKKTIVVSVMGAQSTGKSYLMNRVFGTRFTVASCRTTIGIWMSLIKTQQINFVLLDCQGLLSVHRQLNQQQKFVKILTSISDFTILNLSKSMTSKGMIELMSKLSKSVNKNSEVSQKSKQLYNGQLLMVIRDVQVNQASGLINQLYQSLHKKKQILQFITKFFKSEQQSQGLMIINFPSYTEVQAFKKQVQNLRKIFIQKSQRLPFRNPQSILNWLKIVINQIACDDSTMPEQVMSNRILQIIEQKANQAWKKGNEDLYHKKWQNLDLDILKQLIIQFKKSNNKQSNLLKRMCDNFKYKISQYQNINSVNFRASYETLNKFIIEFCQQRFIYVRNAIQKQYLSFCKNKPKDYEQKVKQKIQQTIKVIQKQKQTIKLCMMKCSYDCQQPCIKIYNHSKKLDEKIKNYQDQVKRKEEWLNLNVLNQQQIALNSLDTQVVKNQCLNQISEKKKVYRKFEQLHKIEKEAEAIQGESKQKSKKIRQNQLLLDNNIYNKHQFRRVLKKMLDIIQLIQKYNIKLQDYNSDNKQVGYYQQLKNICINKQAIKQQQKKLSLSTYFKQKTSIKPIQQQLQKIELAKTPLEELKKCVHQSLSYKTELQKKLSQDICQAQQNQTKQSFQIQQKLKTIQQFEFQIQKLKQEEILAKKNLKQLKEHLDTKKVNIIKQQQQIESFEKQNNGVAIKKKHIQQKFQKINRMINQKRIQSSDLNVYIIPEVIRLFKGKKEVFAQYYRYLMLQQQIQQIIAKFQFKQKTIQENIKKCSNKIKFELGRSTNKNNKDLLQNLKEQKFFIQQFQNSQQQVVKKIQVHNQNVQKFIAQFDMQTFKQLRQDSGFDYQQQKRIIAEICRVFLFSEDKKNNQFTIGLIQNFYHYDKQMMWMKITSCFQPSQIQILNQQYHDFESFKKDIFEVSREQRQQIIKQNESKYKQIQQKIENMDQFMQQLSLQAQKLQKIIQKDVLKLKCLNYCKNNLVFCFQKYYCILLKKWDCMINEQNKKKVKQFIQEQRNLLLKQLQQKNQQINIKDNSITNKIQRIQGSYSQQYEDIKQRITRKLIQIQQYLFENQQIKVLQQDIFNSLSITTKIKKIIKFFTQHRQFHNNYLEHFRSIYLISDNSCFNGLNNNNVEFPSNSIKSFQKILSHEVALNLNFQGFQIQFIKVILLQAMALSQTKQKIQKQKQILKQSFKIQQTILQQIIQKSKLFNKHKKQFQQNLKKLKEQKQSILIQIEQQQDKINVEQRLIDFQRKIQEQKILAEKYLKEKQKLEGQLAQLIKNQQKLKKQIDIISNKAEYIKIYEQKAKQLYNLEQVKKIINNYEQQKLKNSYISECLQQNNKQLKQVNERRIQINQRVTAQKNQLIEYDEIQIKKQIQSCQKKVQKIKYLSQKIKLISKNQEQLKNIQRQLQNLTLSNENRCSCLTDHKCSMKCQVGCQGKLCLQRAGHGGQHACNNHPCDQQCQFDIRCNKICRKVLGHSTDEKHDCMNSHICQKKCKYCDKMCCISIYDNHEIHICSQSKCTKKCIFCQNICSSDHHNHDDQVQIIKIFVQNKQKNQNQYISVKGHLCSDSHKCPSLCRHPGICQFSYQNKKKPWDNNGIEVQYQYIQQIQIKNKCIKSLSAGETSHQGDCQCNCNHFCNRRCPDCRSLCSHSYGHKQSIKHKTYHRNQQNLIYVSKNENQIIEVKSNNQKFLFKAGQISEPFKCGQSCERKGRGHYHLIQCPGGDNCYQKKIPRGARHSDQVYLPKKDKKYDMLLCAFYWQEFNFQMPCQMKEISKCSFSCTLVSDHPSKSIQYCSQQAWHSMSTDRNQHRFTCNPHHKRLFINSVQICFLIDATGSTKKYILQCVKTLKNVIYNCSKDSSLNSKSAKFSIVAYRDHGITESQLFKNLKKLCYQKKQQLKTLNTQPVHTKQMKDVAFQDTLINLQKTYKQKNQKDAHEIFQEYEKFILKYHYPFYLDIESGRKLIDQKRRPNTQYYHLLRSQNQTKTKPLKQILLTQLDYYINLINQQQKAQLAQKQKFPIIEFQPFGTPEKCISFLETLQVGGGGDPPQAVLDGMQRAASLNWSSGESTLRFILHLFDSPPHGKQFDTDNQDYFPDGCPCNKNLKDIINKINEKKISYLIYPFTPKINKTLQIFKLSGLAYQRKQIQKLQQFNQSASNFICNQISQNEIMVKK